ncbi:MAG: hypothetical protein Q9167_001315 [Letrouitia subvulpina]
MDSSQTSDDIEIRLLKASAAGQVERLLALIDERKWTYNPKRKDPILLEAFYTAIENSQPRTTSLLFDRGLRVDLHSVKLALEQKSTAALEEFLKHGWNINKPLFQTMIPPLARALHDEDLVKWFLNHGANPNASVTGWPSPMNTAAMKASLPIIKLLVLNGGRVSQGVLQSAAKTSETGRTEVLDFLLSQGAAINEVEYEWDKPTFKTHWARGYGTALHHAAKRGNQELVTFLIGKGARQDIKDSLRMTPIQSASKNGHERVVGILMEHRRQLAEFNE